MIFFKGKLELIKAAHQIIEKHFPNCQEAILARSVVCDKKGFSGLNRDGYLKRAKI